VIIPGIGFHLAKIDGRCRALDFNVANFRIGPIVVPINRHIDLEFESFAGLGLHSSYANMLLVNAIPETERKGRAEGCCDLDSESDGDGLVIGFEDVEPNLA
jgi:hypothetical protein